MFLEVALLLYDPAECSDLCKVYLHSVCKAKDLFPLGIT